MKLDNSERGSPGSRQGWLRPTRVWSARKLAALGNWCVSMADVIAPEHEDRAVANYVIGGLVVVCLFLGVAIYMIVTAKPRLPW
jgi:hypothetical protein